MLFMMLTYLFGNYYGIITVFYEGKNMWHTVIVLNLI